MSTCLPAQIEQVRRKQVIDCFREGKDQLSHPPHTLTTLKLRLSYIEQKEMQTRRGEQLPVKAKYTCASPVYK